MHNELFSTLADTSYRVLSIPRTYIEFMQMDVTGGLFLRNLIWWQANNEDDDGWWWHTVEQWTKETYLSPYLIRKWTNHCVRSGFLETKIAMHDELEKVVTWYRVDKAAFVQAMYRHQGQDLDELIAGLLALDGADSDEDAQQDRERDSDADWDSLTKGDGNVPQAGPGVSEDMLQYIGKYKSLESADPPVRTVSYLLVKHTNGGIIPPEKRMSKKWTKACNDIWQAADNGNMDAMTRGILKVWANKEKLTVSGPQSFVNTVAAEMALIRSGEADDTQGAKIKDGAPPIQQHINQNQPNHQVLIQVNGSNRIIAYTVYLNRYGVKE